MSALTVNTGSTSVKLALFDISSSKLQRLNSERHSGHGLEPEALLQDLKARLPAAPEVIAHRIVHGGTRFVQPTRLEADTLAALRELSPLAPLHNPQALRWVAAARTIWGPQTLQIAVFDTAFYARLPRVAAEYALAPHLGTDQGVRRHGFHGLAHEDMWRSWCGLYPDLPRGGRLITLQLGGGCSITAIDRGEPVDTSMGFSPLEGLVMETRCGDIDAAVVPYLQGRLGLTADVIVKRLNTEAGLAGLSGSDADPGALLGDASPRSQFAVELYCYRIRKYLGAYLAVLGGCDGIVFGGGIGEHVPGVRARALASLAWAGIALDPSINNAARGGAARIDAAGSAVRVHVVTVDEELALARAAAQVHADHAMQG
jgi:acetate kinase